MLWVVLWSVGALCKGVVGRGHPLGILIISFIWVV